MTPSVQIKIDRHADAAYVRLSSEKIERTEDVTDEVLVDLDRMGVVVGIEVLRLAAKIPFSELTDKYHVHSRVIEIVRAIQPDVGGFVANISSGSDGSMKSVGAGQPQTAPA